MLDNEVYVQQRQQQSTNNSNMTTMMNQHNRTTTTTTTGSPTTNNHHHSHRLMSSHFADLCNSSAAPAMPAVPQEGIVIKVDFVGCCHSEGQLRRRRMRAHFPGMEVAGTVHAVGENLPNCNFTPGDKVILFPDDQLAHAGYTEYLAVPDTRQAMQVPDDLPLEVAAMLPGGALTAYAALLTAKPHVEKLQQTKACVNVLVVGAGGLGLWAVRLAKLVLSSSSSSHHSAGVVRVFVADSSIDKLLTAQQDHDSCHDIVHWNEEDHEQYIVERTVDACRGGVDVILDFVSSPRTMQRSLKVLNREGLVMVGGGSARGSEVSVPLNALAAKHQSLVGIPRGNMNQLRDLLTMVAGGKLSPPCYAVFPIEDLNQVFDDLCECRITGRAIFRVGGGSSASVTDNQ